MTSMRWAFDKMFFEECLVCFKMFRDVIWDI